MKQHETQQSNNIRKYGVKISPLNENQQDENRSVKQSIEMGRYVYLNMHILDPSAAVEDKIKESIEKQAWPKGFKDFAKNTWPQVAKDWASPDIVAEILSDKLTDKIPTKMKEMGLTATMEVAYRQRAFFVLELQIQYVDALLLTKSAGSGELSHAAQKSENDSKNNIQNKGDQSLPKYLFALLSGLVQWLLQVMGKVNKKSMESDYLPYLIHSRLQTALDDIVHEKLSEKRMVAESKVLNEEQQARYFFDKLRELRQRDGKNTAPEVTPLQQISRQLSTGSDI